MPAKEMGFVEINNFLSLSIIVIHALPVKYFPIVSDDLLTKD